MTLKLPSVSNCQSFATLSSTTQKMSTKGPHPRTHPASNRHLRRVEARQPVVVDGMPWIEAPWLAYGEFRVNSIRRSGPPLTKQEAKKQMQLARWEAPK